MALQCSTFDRNEVALFLNREFPYASTLFSRDAIAYGDRVTALFVEQWFHSYFPAEEAAKQYRILETCVTQHMEISDPRSLPIGYEVADNFSPTLRSRIGAKGLTVAVLDFTDGSGSREVYWSTLSTMAWGV